MILQQELSGLKTGNFHYFIAKPRAESDFLRFVVLDGFSELFPGFTENDQRHGSCKKSILKQTYCRETHPPRLRDNRSFQSEPNKPLS